MATATSAGRPRDPRIDEAVLAATRELLVEVGYTQLSYERIAQRAGATRPAMYRRWPSKAHLVHDAVFPVGATELVPDGGSFADDLRQMVHRTLASYARPEARVAVPGLLADLDDPERRRNVVDGLQDQVRAQLADRVARAVAAGEVRPAVDADVLLDTVVGALIHRVVARRSLDPAFGDQLTDLLLGGLRPSER
jgi:AcrR family transcriptional regulator